MDHTSPAFFLLALAVAASFSTITAVIAFALARWDGATIPAAFTRGGDRLRAVQDRAEPAAVLLGRIRPPRLRPGPLPALIRRRSPTTS
ncbi:hypothetical protein [Streptomyces asiaticus]|uniref:hypothetical protein n=1 Tax=Streptomyces asiaticus TaxID=114695 RepID=UPI003F6769D3